jgi:polyhydroxyalkanoate synthesis regulator phasin
MTRSANRTVLVALALAGLLTVGAAAASAHGPGGGPGGGVSALVTEAAKQLDVSRAKLVGAIQDAAVARVDAAVDDGDLEADRASDVEDAARDNLSFAYALSETRTVAAKLGLTTAKLNAGFRAARKALLTAQIDQALEDGRITADQATRLKQRLASATLPGYKGLGFGPGPGLGFGSGGRR